MKTNQLATFVVVFSLGTLSLSADVIRLNDGTVLDGSLGAPSEVTVHTAAGDRRVAFSLLPAEVQKVYWTNGKAAAPTTAQAGMAGVTDEELTALANEVNLETWAQVASIGSFRDRPERRGPGGLVVTKAFNAIEENWTSIYSPKDPVGAAQHWNEQLTRARALAERSPQFMQRRWLELFVKAGEAVARRDSNEFAAAVRELKRSRLTLGGANSPTTASIGTTGSGAPENTRNFFPAK